MHCTGTGIGTHLSQLSLPFAVRAGRTYGLSAGVHSLVTLGTPHHSIEQYPFGRAEETLQLPAGAAPPPPPEVCGSSLRFANYFYPRADCYPGVHVACIVGNSIVGRDLFATKAGPKTARGSAGALEAWLAYQSYKCSCGRGDVAGDGVTPVEVAHLPGAENVVLEGVWHGPKGRAGRPWYGDAADEWAHHLLVAPPRSLRGDTRGPS